MNGYSINPLDDMRNAFVTVDSLSRLLADYEPGD